MQSSLMLFLLLCLAGFAHAQVLPAQFERDRIFVTATAPDRSVLRFYTDTGGGWNAIGQSAAERLRLRPAGQIDVDGGKRPLVDFPSVLAKAGVPAPMKEPWLRGRLVVAPDGALFGADGSLGSRWFAGSVWQIDYPRQTFSMLRNWNATLADHPVALGFRSGDDGKRVMHFPRITVTIAGRPTDLLLDTGATAKLTASSAAAFQAVPGTLVATSYIIKSTFDAWRAAHPSWKVLDAADAITGRSVPMIEVPEVSIGDLAVGPVWFTQRPDAAFREWMAQMMDKPIDGAIGGSGLKYLRVVLDYPGAIAYFSVAQNPPAPTK